MLGLTRIRPSSWKALIIRKWDSIGGILPSAIPTGTYSPHSILLACSEIVLQVPLDWNRNRQKEHAILSIFCLPRLCVHDFGYLHIDGGILIKRAAIFSKAHSQTATVVNLK